VASALAALPARDCKNFRRCLFGSESRFGLETTASAGQRACRARDLQADAAGALAHFGRIIRLGSSWVVAAPPAYFLYINARAYLCLSPAGDLIHDRARVWAGAPQRSLQARTASLVAPFEHVADLGKRIFIGRSVCRRFPGTLRSFP